MKGEMPSEEAEGDKAAKTQEKFTLPFEKRKAGMASPKPNTVHRSPLLFRL